MPEDRDEEFNFITPEEAERRGLNAPKGDDECPFCGRRLEPRGVILNGRVAWVSSERCGCDGEVQAEKAAAAREEEGKERERRSRLVRAGVKTRYMDAKVDTSEAQLYIERFGSDRGRGLYIHGDVGTGKTYLASALACVFIATGYNVVLTTVIEMLGNIQDTYDNEDSTAVAVQRYSKCDVLILDDLGKESGSSWSVSTLFQVVNHRYETMRPLIVTSQYDLATLEKRLARRGERESARAIVSRLRQMCHDVHLSGGDRRRR